MLHDCGVAGPASVRDRLHQRPEAARRADLVHGDDDQVVPVDAAGRASAKLVQEPRMPACPILTRRRQRRYFLFAAAAAPGFALAIASGTLPAVAGAFFLSAFGFLTSRLLLF